MRVLIVEDGRGSYILPAVRSFGTAGWEVGLAGPRPSRAASSRWVRRTHPVPPAEAGLDRFAAAVERAVGEGGYDIVFGGDDVEVLALSAARDRVSACVPHAAHEDVLRSVDKLELARAAPGAGLAVPRTVPATPEAVAAAVPTVVVKARLHWSPGANRARMAATVCATKEEIVRAVSEVEAAGSRAVLQDRVHGDLMAVTALCAPGGRVVAELHQVARRMSPRWRTSTRAETVPVEPELSRQVARLLEGLGWLGIANLQLLAPPGGQPQLIDFNGRFYGSVALALRAGLDLPTRWALLATGGDHPAAGTAAEVGVRYQALEEDLQRARVERRGGLLADVVDTVRYAPGAAHSTWDVTDPRPAAARLVSLAQARWSRHRGRRGEDDG